MYQPLVRKYGVSHFDNIIGQPVVVKILKNTLFLNHIFPFYLFSGKHGCGKTSTARLFSMAINCANLIVFQKDPVSQIPCLLCPSCLAMQKMQHPDFIEIDAASHTGVDNIRIIIESATLLPLVGQKKIYLIDEAHMLSKAACNALLKILEEPPRHVVFILATTAPEKILDTVRSRAFQLLFHGIQEQTVCDYLEHIAKREQISYVKEGLLEIARRGKGSIRDTLNMLDQAKLAVMQITPETVFDVFGGVSDHDVINLIFLVFTNQTIALSSWIKKNIVHTEETLLVFEKIIEHSYVVLLILYNNDQNNSELSLKENIHYKKLIGEYNITSKKLLLFLSFMYEQESAIRRVGNPSLFLELILLEWVQENITIQPQKDPTMTIATESLIETDHQDNKIIETPAPSLPKIDTSDLWSEFLRVMQTKNDPLLSSIFAQAVFHTFEPDKNTMTLHFKKEQLFFESLLLEHQKDWKAVFFGVFGDSAILDMHFITEDKENSREQNQTHISHQDNNQAQLLRPRNHAISSLRTEQPPRSNFFNKQQGQKNINISDEKKWPYARRLQKIFHGIVTEVEEKEL